MIDPMTISKKDHAEAKELLIGLAPMLAKKRNDD